VAGERLPDVLEAGWRLAQSTPPKSNIRFEDLKAIQPALLEVDLAKIRQPFAELVQRIRHAGIPVSDRRAVKLQRAVAASALLCNRTTARLSDLWVLRHIWDAQEQQEVLVGLVNQAAGKEAPEPSDHHRARPNEGPDPEALARDLETLGEQLKNLGLPESERAYIRDRLGILEGRCQWVRDTGKREWLHQVITELWARFKTKDLAA
jgi:MoxR-like ATPase